MQHDSSLLAAVDLGSNSFRLLIGRIETTELGVQILPLDRIKETVRLAAGLDGHGRLSAEAQARALIALHRFGERLRSFQPERVRAVATNTLRVATNAQRFIDTAEAALGFPIEVIGGREEARLIYLGAAHTLSADGSKRLVVDIGGGSTECIIGLDYEPTITESVGVGCVSLSRRHFPDGKVEAAGFEQAYLYARRGFTPIARAYETEGWAEAIGTSGTVKSISQVCRDEFGDNLITRDRLARIHTVLVKAGHVDRVSLAGLKPDRRPVLGGGLSILSAAFDEFRIERMRYASGALREGVLYDLLGRSNHADMREVTVAQMAQRYGVDTGHATRIAWTAVTLFAQVAVGVHEQVVGDTQLLRWASRLHEIGRSIAHEDYHKHAAYIIQHADMPGFSQLEQRMMADLVLGHTGKLGKMTARVEAEQQWLQLLVLRLAVILHRRRDDSGIGDITLERARKRVTIRADKRWAEAHPLTDYSLRTEAAEWSRIRVLRQVVYQTE
ncbi:MAG: Ppx/GppA family phosphatase [Burkholderiales bacterium]|nr:MAG: Ppx/GppA family phosphatase [Burkholderiales bacterium]